MKERIQIKHDIAENWAKAKNFIPLSGELILYDGVIEDGKYTAKPQLKIGDGIHKLNELPFFEPQTHIEDNNKMEYEYESDTGTLILK